METCAPHQLQFGRERKHSGLSLPSNVDQGGYLSCPLCPETSADPTSLYEHTLSNHPHASSKAVKCPVCRKRLSDYILHLRVHVKEQHACAGPSCGVSSQMDWDVRGRTPIEVLQAEASDAVKPWAPNSPAVTGRGMSSPGGTSEQPSPGSEGGASPSVSAASPLPTHPSPPQLVKPERPPSPPPPERPPSETDSVVLRERFVQQLLLNAFSLEPR